MLQKIKDGIILGVGVSIGMFLINALLILCLSLVSLVMQLL